MSEQIMVLPLTRPVSLECSTEIMFKKKKPLQKRPQKALQAVALEVENLSRLTCPLSAPSPSGPLLITHPRFLAESVYFLTLPVCSRHRLPLTAPSVKDFHS